MGPIVKYLRIMVFTSCSIVSFIVTFIIYSIYNLIF